MGEMVRIGVGDFVGKKYGTPHSFQAREGAVGSQVQAGEELAKLVMGGKILVLGAPIAGRVLAFNRRLREEPGLLASDPYQGGWFAYMEPAKSCQEAVKELLAPSAYTTILRGKA